jgi:hypothetical protein
MRTFFPPGNLFWWPTIYFKKSWIKWPCMSSDLQKKHPALQALNYFRFSLGWAHFFLPGSGPTDLIPDPNRIRITTRTAVIYVFCSHLCRISNPTAQVRSLAIFPVKRTCCCLCLHWVCRTSGRERQTSGRERQTSGRGRKTSVRNRQTSGRESQTSGRDRQTSGQMCDVWCRVRLSCQHKQPSQASTEVPTVPDRLGTEAFLICFLKN